MILKITYNDHFDTSPLLHSCPMSNLGPHSLRVYWELNPDSEISCLYHMSQLRDALGKPLRRIDTSVENIHENLKLDAANDTAKPAYLDLNRKSIHAGLSSIPNFNSDHDHLEIEIGSGKGSFIVDYAEKNTDVFLVGLEQVPSIATYAAERIAKRIALKKVSIIHGEAHLFLSEFLPPHCVSAFHMYFPDPWPKKRHAKRRTLNPEFLKTIQQLAKKDALFYWGTDFKAYHDDATEHFKNAGFVCIAENAEPTAGIMTNFEKKYRIEGRPIYRSVYRVGK